MNPLNRNEQLSVYKAIINSDVDYIHQNIVNHNLVNAHLDLNDISDVPSVLKFSPPIISIAAYYDSKEVFDYLYMNNASISEVDKIYFFFFLIIFLIFYI